MNKLYSLLKYIACSIISIVIYVMVSQPIPFEYESINENSDCLVDAALFARTAHVEQRLLAGGIWGEIVCFVWVDAHKNIIGHAICIFRYNGEYYVYDPNGGSFKLLGGLDLDEAIARSLPNGATLMYVQDIISPE